MAAQTEIASNARNNMNRMYKLTRHVYDFSRKFYLLGRDHLISQLQAQPGEHVIEVGCGTARNLIKMSAAYPQTHFYGLDAADEMLKTARQSLLRAQKADKVLLAQGLAQTFSPKEQFNIEKQPDKIVFSYVLSMIPNATDAIDHALDLLPSGGEIHIADFDDLSGHPSWIKSGIEKWLSLFHVRHDPKLIEYYKKIDRENIAEMNYTPLYNNYAHYVRIKKN